VEENAMTEKFRAFNDFAVVCEACYERLKAYHAGPCNRAD